MNMKKFLTIIAAISFFGFAAVSLNKPSTPATAAESAQAITPAADTMKCSFLNQGVKRFGIKNAINTMVADFSDIEMTDRRMVMYEVVEECDSHPAMLVKNILIVAIMADRLANGEGK
jgi:hypothetical protein